jgi:hypothetical protein
MHWLLRGLVVATVALAARSVAAWCVEMERQRSELLRPAQISFTRTR